MSTGSKISKCGARRPWATLVAAFCIAAAGVGMAAERSGGDKNPGAERGAAQRRAAEDYLAALASGDPRAIAQTIGDDELEQLRKNLLDEMKLEADRNESVVRSRLFGPGMPLADLERMTPQNFFVALAPRLRFGGRPFDRVDWLDAVGDKGGMVQMVGRLIPPKDEGTVRVPVLVSIVPWGKDWKAALPLELQAQIDDLRTGRVNPPGVAPLTAGAATPTRTLAPAASVSATPPEILELFDAAQKSLTRARCDDYYEDQMSPNFRRTTGKKALRALINACKNREEVRSQMLTALQLARKVPPRYEYQGTRAVYDLTGQGLPFSELVLEQVDKHWYIAE
jgi:hypothetical protein